MQTTDIVIDFTTGLSGSVAWPWPIAVYLFLAGISGGAVALAIIINLYKGTHADNPQMKAATMVGLVTILLGMVCLVLDLTDLLQPDLGDEYRCCGFALLYPAALRVDAFSLQGFSDIEVFKAAH